MKFYTSDLHLGHKNIIKLCKRPFDNVEDMNSLIIHNWNKTVNPDDEVYILGDFIFGDGKEANKYLSKLNGIKYLILGNHDKFVNDNSFDRSLFKWIKQYAVIKDTDVDVVLFHYPILDWDKKYHGSIHLYGHVHNNNEFNIDNAFNVGVDVNNFKPVTIKNLTEEKN